LVKANFTSGLTVFDAIRYLRDIGRQFWTSGKNVSDGWTNICCPFCSDNSNHGGFSPADYDGPSYSCWRCRSHSLEDVIMALERVPYHEACQRVRQYTTDFRPILPILKTRRISGQLKLPMGTRKMEPRHKEYLRKRRFDPDVLETKYNLLGTGPAGHLPHRIVIPIFYQGRMVSWQARDMTGKAELKYKSASPDAEEVSHKTILYNLDNCRGQSILVVEGVTDVWRFGDDTAGTFGVKFTQSQLLILSKYEQVFFVYDGEPEAQAQAEKACRILSGVGVVAENVILNKGDPGSMTDQDAQKLKTELLKE
jgi:hypothetical protein